VASTRSRLGELPKSPLVGGVRRGLVRRNGGRKVSEGVERGGAVRRLRNGGRIILPR